MSVSFALPGTPIATVARVHPVVRRLPVEMDLTQRVWLPPLIRINLHALAQVLCTIADAFTRREEGLERVIGTLLGNWTESGLEVKSAYAVPHSEADGQVWMDVNYHRNMCELHQRANPKEVMVGWFSTGTEIASTDTLVHEFYTRECHGPTLHLVVDPSLKSPSRALTGWVGMPLHLTGASDPQQPVGTHFQQIQVELKMAEAERVGVSLLQRTQTEKQPSDLQSLDDSLEKLETLMQRVYDHVNGVCEGRIEADTSLGRFLTESLSAVPYLTEEHLNRLFDESVQDVLLIMYLANITRTQLALAERLNTAATS